MKKEEIKDRIFSNNEKIKKLLDPSIFIFQPEIQLLMEDNERLQLMCEHEFKNGVCEICGKIE